MDLKDQIIQEYLNTGCGLRKLAAKYSISRTTIFKWVLIHQGIHNFQPAQNQQAFSTSSMNSSPKKAADQNQQTNEALLQKIADNAIVMNDSLIHNGHSAIANNWISGGVKVLSNIKTTSVIKDSDNKIAYDGGTYTLDLTPPGGPVLKEKANYNIVWTKQQNGEWKLTLIHIEDITRIPDIT